MTARHRLVVVARDPADVPALSPGGQAGGLGAGTGGQLLMDVKRSMARRLAGASLATGILASLAAGGALAGGPPAIGFYVDGDLYRTVGTPTDFSQTGAPAHSFDTIYALGNGLRNVAEAKPGDRDFNGGRWMVLPVTWNVTPVQLTSAEQVESYAEQGWLTIGTTPVKQFECPVIPLGGQHAS